MNFNDFDEKINVINVGNNSFYLKKFKLVNISPKQLEKLEMCFVESDDLDVIKYTKLPKGDWSDFNVECFYAINKIVFIEDVLKFFDDCLFRFTETCIQMFEVMPVLDKFEILQIDEKYYITECGVYTTSIKHYCKSIWNIFLKILNEMLSSKKIYFIDINTKPKWKKHTCVLPRGSGGIIQHLCNNNRNTHKILCSPTFDLKWLASFVSLINSESDICSSLQNVECCKFNIASNNAYV